MSSIVNEITLAFSFAVPIIRTPSMAESFLVAATALCVAAFVVPQRSQLWQSIWKFGVSLIALANVTYALVEPLYASSLARIAMAMVSFAGLTLSFMRRGEDAAAKAHARFFWVALCCWTIIAGVVVLQTDPRPTLGAQFGAVSALVLLVLCVVLLRIGTAQGLAGYVH